MRQLLFAFCFFTFFSTNLQANTSGPYDNTAWNVIRERLFNGKNSNAFRYEENIRFKIEGVQTKEDSVFFAELISELDELLETVEVELVNDSSNFLLKIRSENGFSLNQKQTNSGARITYTKLELGFPDISNMKIHSDRIYYYTLRNLTKLFDPRHGHSSYGGIFDSSKPDEAKLHDIDKTLLKKVYSREFYKELRINTIKRKGIYAYLNLRFSSLLKNLHLSLAIILAILGFLQFLSTESKRDKNPVLWRYLIQRSVLILFIAISYQLPQMYADVPIFYWKSLLVIFLLAVAGTFMYGILALILIYFTERIFLPKIEGFIRQQIFIFLNTIVSIFAISAFVALVVNFNFSISSPTDLSSSPLNSSMLQNSTKSFLIILIASLRVLYNFLKYKLQSIVNAKDVEIARMKELKNQAELAALHSRINPHFLYNSLNSIAVLAHTDAEKTENMATGLSELFRYSINKENKTYVSVTEELKMVEKYLLIEKTRFEHRLNYRLEVDDSCKEKLIPKFLIQPLAENAIKHGISKSNQQGEVFIEVKKQNNNMLITIYDNGPDFPNEPVSGYGLQNLYDKLEIIYGDGASVNWENGKNKHISILLKNQF